MKSLIIPLATILLSIPSAWAQQKLIWQVSPAGRSNIGDYLEEVGKHIAAASNGALEFDFRYGPALANFSNMIDRVDSDVIQIGWMFPGMFGEKFRLTETLSLPYVMDDAVVGSVALWRLYKTGALDADYREFLPLMFGITGINTVHFAKPLSAPDDFKGQKIRVGSKSHSQAIQVFGGTPLVIASLETYEALQRRTVDGAVIPWTAFATFKLNEVTSYHVEVPLGGTTGAVFMSRKRFEALPAAARKAIEENIQEVNTRRFATELAKQGIQPRATALAHPDKHRIVELAPDKAEMWKQRVTAVILKEWFEKFPDARKVLDDYAKIYAEVKAGR
jgi:TRAP-type C4-dicarboxylate transport system substrate-binding protein